MKIFDTHLHLQDFDLLPFEWGKAISKCICVSAMPSDWEKVRDLTKAFPSEIVPAFGLHPWYIDKAPTNWKQLLKKFLETSGNACVGECGLDRLKGASLDMQKSVFQAHIDLAKTYQRPILIHCVKAWDILDAFGADLPPKFVFHSFNAHLFQARWILDFGGYIAVNASILRSKDFDSVLKFIPADRLLLESDAPYQTKLSDLPDLCAKIAHIRGEKLEDLVQQLYLNAKELTNE